MANRSNVVNVNRPLPVNTVRRVNSNQLNHPVIIAKGGRQPIVSTSGTGLNSGNVPSTSSKHILSQNQRKVG